MNKKLNMFACLLIERRNKKDGRDCGSDKQQEEKGWTFAKQWKENHGTIFKNTDTIINNMNAIIDNIYNVINNMAAIVNNHHSYFQQQQNLYWIHSYTPAID